MIYVSSRFRWRSHRRPMSEKRLDGNRTLQTAEQLRITIYYMMIS